MNPRAQRYVALGTLAGAALYAVACVRNAQLFALSDDDYARFVIAAAEARSAHIDPSGSSWLPLPFWLYGSWIRIGNACAIAPLSWARVLPWLLSVLGSWLIYAGSRALALSRSAACAATLAALGTVQAAQLASMTGPEFPTACMCYFALAARGATRRPNTPAQHSQLLGWASAVSAAAAALSRYEAWPVALVVAAFGLLPRRNARFLRRCAEACVALSGLAFWLALNTFRHANAFHFLHRVAAYRDSLGSHFSAAQVLASYAHALAFSSPVVSLALVLVILSRLCKRARGPAHAPLKVALADVPLTVPLADRPLTVPLAGVVSMLLFLAIGALAGGVPTHHAERALLTLWLVAAAAIASQRHIAWTLAALQLLLLPLGAAKTDGFSRREQEDIGRSLRGRLHASERVLIATPDYGYFAVQAALGGSEYTQIDRDHDPRHPERASRFHDAADVWALRDAGVRFVVAPSAAWASPYATTRTKTLTVYDLHR